jgi:hypothetical protein
MANRTASLIRNANLPGIGWRRGTLIQSKNGRIKDGFMLYNGVEYPRQMDPSTVAARLREQRGFTLPDVRVCLGRLESRDFRPLSPQRKGAVQAFWSAYLSDKGGVPEIRLDGTEMLADPEQGCLGVER